MNKALVIYDNSGTVLAIYWGDDVPTPNGVPYVWVDMPQNATINHIDVNTGKPVFDYLPETDLGQLQSSMASLTAEMQQLENNYNQYIENYSQYVADVSATQLAITELYEMMLASGTISTEEGEIVNE